MRILAKALDVEITGRVVSLYDRVEAARVPALVDAIKAGATVLVVSDAGMPLISDPGYRLVVACVDAGLPVQCLPGPSAVTTALAVSGLPSERFCFEGFAPRKKLGAPNVVGRRWPTSGAPVCSLSRRAGWPRACAMPRSSSAVHVRRWCAGS